MTAMPIKFAVLVDHGYPDLRYAFGPFDNAFEARQFIDKLKVKPRLTTVINLFPPGEDNGQSR